MKKLSFDHFHNGVFYTVPPKLFIEIPQLKTRSERLNLIQKDHNEIYMILEDIKQLALRKSTGKEEEKQEIKKKIESAFSQFKPMDSKLNPCANKIQTGYQCITCKQHQQILICENCFDLQHHRGHNWVVKKMLKRQQCDCPFCDQNLCKHHPKQKNFCEIICPDVQLWSFISFCSDLLMFFSQNVGCHSTHKIFVGELARFIKPSQVHRIATLYCLVMKESPQSTNSWSVLDFNEAQQFSCFLLDYGPLSLLSLQRSFSDYFQSEALSPWLCKSHKLMIELSKNVELFMGKNEAFDAIYRYLPMGDIAVEIGRSYSEITRNLFKKHQSSLCIWLRFQSLRWQIYGVLADDPVDDLATLKGMLLAEISLNFSLESEWYNKIVRCVLRAVKGNLQSFPSFFQLFDKQLICKFVQTYFLQLFRTRQKVKFNNLTIVCLYRLSKAMGNFKLLPDNLHYIHIRKFAMNLRIFLRNLITREHTTYSKIHEVAVKAGNKELQSVCQKQICEWFQDFLFTQTEVSQSRIKSLMDQKIINFPQAIAILHQNTSYIHSRKMFVYTGPSRQVNSDIALSHVSRKEQIYGLKYQQFDGLFHTEEREQILNALFKEGPLKVHFEHYRSISQNDRYTVNMTAVICDNIVRGKNQHLTNYINQLIKCNNNFKTKSPLLKRLYETPKSIPIFSDKKQIQMEEVLVQDFMKEQQAIVSESNALKSQTRLNQDVNTNTVQQKEEIVIQSEPQIMKQTSLIVMHPKQQPKVKKFFSDEKQNLRTQKLRKINQKFQRKTTKYTENIPQKEQQQQHCLICREYFCQKQQFLVYLASIKYDDISQLLFGTNSQRIITSCFHPYHQSCLSEMGKSSCVLCKFEGNMILPVLSCDGLSQYYANIWWNDFLSLTNFQPIKQPKPTYYSYYSYNISYDAQKQQEKNAMKPCSQNQSLNYFSNFLMIWQSCVLRLGPLASLKVRQQGNRNRSNEYFQKLIKFYYDEIDTSKQKEIVKAITQNLQKKSNNSLSETSDYAKDLIRVASQAFLLNIQSKNENKDCLQRIKSQVQEIVTKYSLPLTNNFVLSIESLLKLSIFPITSSQATQLTPTYKIFLQKFTPSIPKNMAQVYKFRSQCPKCQITSKWICLFCLSGVCGSCCHLESHMKQKHNSGFIFAIEVNQGKAIWRAKGVSIFEGEIYFDEIFNKFQQKTEILERFVYCEEIGVKIFQQIVKIF